MQFKRKATSCARRAMRSLATSFENVVGFVSVIFISTVLRSLTNFQKTAELYLFYDQHGN